MRRFLLALNCAAALACGGEPTAPNKSPTSIRLQSDAEDSVGSGKTYDYSLANAVLIVSARTDTFVGMYVNDLTLSYGERGRKAVERLMSEAFEKKLIPRRVSLEFAGA